VQYLASSSDPFVHKIWESLPGNEAASSLGNTEFSVLQNDPSAADDDGGASAHLQALKDVDLHRLDAQRDTG